MMQSPRDNAVCRMQCLLAELRGHVRPERLSDAERDEATRLVDAIIEAAQQPRPKGDA
ncbi:MAG: hypothetical protein ABSH47_14910 [Bryobacteraceae bacterium]|jgi:hypothetical protein